MNVKSKKVSSKSETGFTLVELLVVIAIIGVLVSLLLPAVQAARAAARRTQCQNNIRQVGLAVLNYESAQKALPQFLSWWKEPGSVDFAEKWNLGPNWLIAVLPYMEQQAIFDSFDFTAPINQPANEIARSAVIPGLLCPEDADSNSILFSGTSSLTAQFGENWGRTNYGANAGLYYGPLTESQAQTTWKDKYWADFKYRGVFSSAGQSKLKEVIDGTSSTIMIGELRAGIVEFDLRGTWAMSGAAPSGLSAHGYFGDDNGPNNLERFADDVVGCTDIQSAFGRRTGVEELQRQRFGCSPFGDNAQQAPRSVHQGGVFVCLVDGSVQFISDDIELSNNGACCSTWDRLNLASDEQVLDSDAF